MAVDFCPPKAVSVASGGFCTSYGECFASAEELRAHCKSERHVYNVKRQLAGLKPISQEAWERKLRERETEESTKGRAHLKAGKQERKAAEGYERTAPDQAEELTFSPLRCLFDKRSFNSVEENLAYMWKVYSFFIPDREYCTDLEGLLEHLWTKLNVDYTCIFCGRRFPDAASTRRHMLDKAHTRIGTEARTRRGKLDDLGSQHLEAELEAFYDFTGSTREITERITEPVQRLAAIFRYFDEDRDGFLCHAELTELWRAVADEELSVSMFQGACSQVGADAKRGLDMDALGQLYMEGFADLAQHFSVLEDLLSKKLSKFSRKALGPRQAEDRDEDEDDDEDGESSGTEIVECDDEEEFEEVMRILGLQQATVLENGDLRLPNGMVAANRDVAHIWKQRGLRAGPLAVAGGAAGKRVRAHLMLTSDPCGKVELTRREQKREGKRVIAVLKEKNKQEMRLGMQMNAVLKGKPKKFRTLMGDASGGR